ncbi:MAG: hypothetical protein RR768_03530 [Clostridium sp.]
MKKSILTILVTIIMAVSMSVTVFAGAWKQDDFGDWVLIEGQWKQDNRGKWYEYNDGTFPLNEWQWINENKYDNAKRYYFDERGYLLKNTSVPDGSQVNANGEWLIDGKVREATMYKNSIDITVINFGFRAKDAVDVKSYGYTEEGISNIVVDILNHSRQENFRKYDVSLINYRKDSISNKFKGLPLGAEYAYDVRIDGGTGKMNYTPFSICVDQGYLKLFLTGLDNVNTMEGCVEILKSRGFSVISEDLFQAELKNSEYVIYIQNDNNYGFGALIMTKQRYDDGLWIS